MPEVRELRQMREENARLKRLVADLTLDKQILQEVIRKNVWSAPVLQVTHTCWSVRDNVSGLLLERVRSWP